MGKSAPAAMGGNVQPGSMLGRAAAGWVEIPRALRQLRARGAGVEGMESSAGGLVGGWPPGRGIFPPDAPTVMPEPWVGAVGGRRGRGESRKGNHGGRSGAVDEPRLALLASPCPSVVTISHYGSLTMGMRSLSPKLSPGVHGRDGAVSQRGSRSCGAPRTGWVQAAGDGGPQRGVCTWGVQGMGVLGSG